MFPCPVCDQTCPDNAPECPHCGAQLEARFTAADETAADRAALLRRLRAHLFACADTDSGAARDRHALAVYLLREAAAIFGPCQSEAEYRHIADYVDCLADEYGSPATF